MKNILFLLSVILLTINAGLAAELPRFKDFPIAEVYEGTNSPVDLSTPEAHKFRTRLREASLQKPNFAGHYILTRWGCGSGCVQPAIINAKNGRVFIVPFTITTVGEEVVDILQFRPDSQLFIVNGSRNDQPENGIYYYLWDGKKLKLIGSVDKK